MVDETISITIGDDVTGSGKFDIDIDDFTSEEDDAQRVIFTDNADITEIEIAKMGKDDNAADEFVFDLRAFNDDFSIDVKSEGPEDTFIMYGVDNFSVDGSGVYTIDYTDPDGTSRTVVLDPGDAQVLINPVCFAPGTMIATPEGEVPVETLAPGHLVLTADRGARPVRWIGRTRHELSPSDERNRPIEIKAGALGPGLPARRLIVSPQHRVAMGGPAVHRLFGEQEVLALAKALVGLPGVRLMHGRRDIVYISVLCDRHELVCSEGAWSETFYPGPTALEMIGSRQASAVEALFPELRANPETGFGPTARRVLNRRETESLVAAIGERNGPAGPVMPPPNSVPAPLAAVG